MKVTLQEVRAEICRRDLKEFILEFWPEIEPATPFVDGWVVDCFVDHLAHLREIRNLLVNCPPGVSKSSIFSVLFPVWVWVNEPSAKFLTGSYSLPLADRDSAKARRLILSEKFQRHYPVRLLEDQNRKSSYGTHEGGYRQTTATQGATAGHKGNYLILDDPHNTSEADSDTKRELTCRWFVDSFYNRVADFKKDCRIVIGQRIHPKDLSGYILDHFSDWTHLVLPWEYRPTTYVTTWGWSDPRKSPGEPLWPERYPASEINNLKRRPVSYAAQWQQNPIGGTEESIFNAGQFRYYTDDDNVYKTGEKEVLKDNCFALTAVDPAYGEHSKADFTVIITADVSPQGDIFLRDIVRQRIGVTKLIPILARVNELYKPIYILVENVTIGGIVAEQARAAGLPVKPVRTKRGDASGDIKVIRSLDLQLAFEDGRLYFPLGKDWLAPLEQEIQDFPNGSVDDQVDALSYLCADARHRTRYSRQFAYGNAQDQDKIREDYQAKKRWHEMLWGD